MDNADKISSERLFESVAARSPYFALNSTHCDKYNNVLTANAPTTKVTPAQQLVDKLGSISTSRPKFRGDIRCHPTLGPYTAFGWSFPLLWTQRVDGGFEHNQDKDLELMTDSVERTAPYLAEPPACLVGKTVLLVEDDRTTRIIIKALLEQHGMLCVEAENGQEALTLFTSTCFSLVITDLQMPVMNGVDLIKAIRELEASADYDRGEAVPIVIITSEKGDILNSAIQAGANTYLAKPVVAEELEHTLQLLL